ncbi:DNA polymerase III subunit beta [Vagococcus carniphilus]|uniref:DNA polymerase III subunit beta n=1 Tax=Vagococcus carniphilus TaxID=218144 RepID=UPI00288D9055|nr:DNA polymerase III subunit beta [Vagococcus carniphilus]MDT2864660.1 DNA polymerase III subunit beta [Vagococcus carniphilus]
MEIKNLHRHLKRAASNFESRPILKCVHYDEDGSIAVTDSHRLLVVKDFHNHEKEFNQDLTTMKLNDGVYPDVHRLIPEEFKTEITISLTVLIRIMKALGTNKEEFVTWKLSDEQITFSNQSDAQMYGGPVQISANASVTGEKFDISFSAKYVKECCEFFMDAKERYAVDNVTIKMVSPLRPVVFSIDESKHVYLVTPVRMG